MEDVQAELAVLALYLKGRREAILEAWQQAVKWDPKVTTGDSLPRVQLLDHIPSLLATFERALHGPSAAPPIRFRRRVSNQPPRTVCSAGVRVMTCARSRASSVN